MEDVWLDHLKKEGDQPAVREPLSGVKKEREEGPRKVNQMIEDDSIQAILSDSASPYRFGELISWDRSVILGLILVGAKLLHT